MVTAILQSKISEMVVDETARQSAQRTLRTLGESVTEENVKLVLALRDQSGGRARVNKTLFNEWKHAVVETCRREEKYWMVPRNLKDSLCKDPEIADCVVDTDKWKSFPPGFNPDKHFLLDQKIPRSNLPKGICEIVASVGNERKRNSDDASSMGQIALPDQVCAQGPSEVAAPKACPPVQPVLDEAAEPAEKKRRILSAQISSGTDEDEVEKCAAGAKCAFDQKLLVSEDRNVASAEYWLRAFVRTMQSQKRKGQPLQADLYLLPKFVASQLLEQAQGYQVLPRFAAEFEKLKQVAPEVLEKVPLVEALVCLSNYSVASEEELLLENLSISARAKLVKSALYQQFMGTRFEARVQQAIALKDDVGKQKTLIERLLTEQKDPRLLFAATWHGGAALAEKHEYLLSDPKHFEYLSLWKQQDECLCLRSLTVQEIHPAQDDWVKDFFAAADLVVDHLTPAILKAVPNPVCKQLLSDYAKGFQLTGNTEFRAMVKPLFCELAELKLGVMSPKVDVKLPALDLDSLSASDIDIIKGLWKLCSPRGSKDDRCSTHAALVACVQAKKEKDAAAKPVAPKKENEEKKPEPEAPQESGDSFQVGDKVVCKLTKKTQANYLFDGESGTVEKILKEKCRVYFPALKDRKDFNVKCLQKQEDAKASTSPKVEQGTNTEKDSKSLAAILELQEEGSDDK